MTDKPELIKADELSVSHPPRLVWVEGGYVQIQAHPPGYIYGIERKRIDTTDKLARWLLQLSEKTGSRHCCPTGWLRTLRPRPTRRCQVLPPPCQQHGLTQEVSRRLNHNDRHA